MCSPTKAEKTRLIGAFCLNGEEVRLAFILYSVFMSEEFIEAIYCGARLLIKRLFRIGCVAEVLSAITVQSGLLVIGECF